MATPGVAHITGGGQGRAFTAAAVAVLDARALRIALLVLGLAAAPLIDFSLVRDDGVDALDTIAVLVVLVGWSFVVSGFIAWGRRPGTGALLMFLGFWWIAGRSMMAPTTWSPFVNSVGAVWRLAWVFAFVLLLLTFPGGRLSAPFEKLIAGAVFVAAVPLQIAWLLFLELDAPRNGFLVWRSSATADVIDTAQRVIWLCAAVTLVTMFSVRWLRASSPLRRALVPLLAGGVTVLLFSALVIVQQFRPVPVYLAWSVLAGYTLVPIALLASILRARLARSSVAELLVELRSNPAPGDLRDALARALGDPSLSLGYWLPEYETYADLDGRPIELSDEAGRATTLVERDGAHVVALVHDATLRDDPALLDAVCAAAGIALENAQLQAELRARLVELKGSRARIVEATLLERQRLERDLHDGAQQRLVSLSIELGVLGGRLDGDADAKRALTKARRELAESLEELRELARGIHPAVVTGHGLAVALESLAARAPVPVRLAVDVASRLPEQVEVAAYYLVSEALTNVAKHAFASGAAVELTRANGELVVEVVDDGVGGANTSRGSGLRGLADRVEALDGRLRVWSPPDGGTRIRAEIPCA